MTENPRLRNPENWYLYYVASPYTSPDPAVSAERCAQAVEAAKVLTRIGYAAFVPIAYNAPWTADPTYKVDTTWEFWESIDLPFLDRCAALILLEIPGWEKSRGVNAELDHCHKVGIPVMSISLEDLKNEEVLHTKMRLLQGMVKRNKRTIPPQFKAEDRHEDALNHSLISVLGDADIVHD